MRRRILHLSDLHFGRDIPELLEPLVESVNTLAPDLVAVTGDFTQRARHRQYRAARAFLDRLVPPVMAVPGNHDTPLDNPAARLLWPWWRYRRYIAKNLEPEFSDEVVSVVGVNTSDPYAWQRGRIRTRAVERICRAFDGRPEGRMNVVMMHHPLEQIEEAGKHPTRGAARAIEALGACGTDIILSGHLHNWRALPFEAHAGVMLIQAGTGLSSRHRGEANDFNLLDIGPDDLRLTRYTAEDPVQGFHPTPTAQFAKREGIWQSVEDPGAG